MRGRLFPELAILPDAFDPSNFESAEAHRVALAGLRQVLERQGVVRDLHRGDCSAFRESLERSGGSLNARVFLQFLAKRGLCVRVPSCNGKDWPEEAILSHKARPLAAVVTDEIADLSHGSLRAAPLTALLDRPWTREWVVSVDILASAQDFADCFEPLLRFGRVVHLIDPYFDMADQRCERVLRAMMQRASRDGEWAVFCVHGSWDLIRKRHRDPKDCENEMLRWWNKYRRLFDEYRLIGELHFWDPAKMLGGFHARCVLCDFAGCLSDRSFQELRGKSVLVSLLAPDQRREILRRFDPESSGSESIVRSFGRERRHRGATG